MDEALIVFARSLARCYLLILEQSFIHSLMSCRVAPQGMMTVVHWLQLSCMPDSRWQRPPPEPLPAAHAHTLATAARMEATSHAILVIRQSKFFKPLCGFHFPQTRRGQQDLNVYS